MDDDGAHSESPRTPPHSPRTLVAQEESSLTPEQTPPRWRTLFTDRAKPEGETPGDAASSSNFDVHEEPTEYQEAEEEGASFLHNMEENVEGEVVEEHHFAGRIGMTFTVLEEEVVVTEVDPEGDAAEFGVKPGDLICEVSASAWGGDLRPYCKEGGRQCHGRTARVVAGASWTINRCLRSLRPKPIPTDQWRATAARCHRRDGVRHGLSIASTYRHCLREIAALRWLGE